MANPPLSGIRVLDLTNVLAGPYCTYQLMLYGAEVIKIEVPDSGDLARHLGPDAELNRASLGASFLAQNAGKKSVELNLKDAGDRESFEDLVRGADVLVENFRAGVLTRLGFGWDHLHALNSSLVYCAITGFGQTGPMSQAPAYDQIIQGLSGMMSITGTKQTAPQRVGFPVCDTVGGLMAALAITAALAGRQRTGEGCFLDLSMLEASISAMGWPATHLLISGIAPAPMGTQNATAAPSGTFDTADGPLNIAANRQSQFESLCRVIGRPDLAGDVRFADGEARKRHREALDRELNMTLRLRSAAHWEQVLPAAGVPAARILSVAQAVQLPQLEQRGFFTEVALPGDAARKVRVTGNGVLVDGEALRPAGPAPRLGEHNSEVRALIAERLPLAVPAVAAEQEVS